MCTDSYHFLPYCLLLPLAARPPSSEKGGEGHCTLPRNRRSQTHPRPAGSSKYLFLPRRRLWSRRESNPLPRASIQALTRVDTESCPLCPAPRFRRPDTGLFHMRALPASLRTELLPRCRHRLPGPSPSSASGQGRCCSHRRRFLTASFLPCSPSSPALSRRRP